MGLFTRLISDVLNITKGTGTALRYTVRQYARTYRAQSQYPQVSFGVAAGASTGCDFELPNAIMAGSIVSRSRMGRHSYCAGECRLSDCVIGRYCSIGPGVRIGLPAHPVDRISTHPSFYSRFAMTGSYRFDDTFNEYRTTSIGHDVWIGAAVIIPGGISVGDGAIIASGAVVTKDVPPYAIMGGVPAKLIRFRFPPQVVSSLMQIAWWNWNDTEIQKSAAYFADVDLFLRQFDVSTDSAPSM